MKTVDEISELVKDWVITQSGDIPGFLGAYLFGGITQLPGKAFFPDYRDVDLIVVTEGKSRPGEENLEIDVNGVMLEVGFGGMDEYASSEIIASNPSIAPNFFATQILADPNHFLGPLQKEVISLYAQRKWVTARCNTERKWLENNLESFRQAEALEIAWNVLWNLLNNVSGLLALADLRKPTHRRSLTLLKDILSAHGQRVQELLDETGRLFDRALQVKHHPSPFDFKLKPHLRPYFTAASQEMIDEGNHREATFWIVAGYIIASGPLLQAAPDDEKVALATSIQAIAEEFGIGSPAARLVRYQMAQSYCGKITALADRIIQQNPKIIQPV
jgi:hypothetical protein